MNVNSILVNNIHMQASNNTNRVDSVYPVNVNILPLDILLNIGIIILSLILLVLG